MHALTNELGFLQLGNRFVRCLQSGRVGYSEVTPTGQLADLGQEALIHALLRAQSCRPPGWRQNANRVDANLHQPRDLSRVEWFDSVRIALTVGEEHDGPRCGR